MLKIALSLLFLFSLPSFAEVKRLDYTGFTIWLDCDAKSAVRFRYNAQRDTGNFKRHSKFYTDPNLSKECQQTSTASYKGKHPTGTYDRGHLVPANHLDSDEQSIKESNYMVNIVPQAANANRGAWLRTEEIIECLRDEEEIFVLGGVIYDQSTATDYFYKTHGIRTPSALWKILLKGTAGKEEVVAWIVPNTADAKRDKLDDYLVSVGAIEKITGESIIDIPAKLKNQKAAQSWSVPKGCDKS